jgi:UDP-N-acetylmuramoyl-L-alanyl-D-glutamate--2,6-diaminopimelate ligase
VLTDAPREWQALAERQPPVYVVADANPRRRLALMAASFYGRQPRTLVAVTGTNGKTSTADFTRQIWRALGHRSASLGTIGIVGPDFHRPGSLTTPDPVTLHRELAELAGAGIEHVALEASSHGLDQYRLDGLQPTAAAFTNLTRDHLDYHGSMGAYFTAKARLFDAVMPTGGTAVLNADSGEFDKLAAISRNRGHRIIGYGAARRADLRLVSRRPTPEGQLVTADLFGARHEFLLPLVGAFQAMNAMAAAGLAIATGAAADRVVEILPRLEGVAGRMQRVATLANGAAVYIDYAHTPDALDNVLNSLRPHAARRLVVVFGCGGDRDPGKRPVMGGIAERLADLAYVTDDNPRGEDPAAIRAAVLAGCHGAREIGDREAAIRAAMGELEAGDLLVVAGKGHERGQTIAGVVHPFDDAEVCRRLATELGGRAA